MKIWLQIDPFKEKNVRYKKEKWKHTFQALQVNRFPWVKCDLQDDAEIMFCQHCEEYLAYANKRSPGTWIAYLVKFLPFEGNNKELSDILTLEDFGRTYHKDYFINWKFHSIYHLSFQDIGWMNTFKGKILAKPKGFGDICKKLLFDPIFYIYM